jgi:hypothetical protein
MRFEPYRHAARRALGLSIAPYGYTLTVWTSGSVLTHARGVPGTREALLFMLGAVAAFGLLGLAAFGRPTARIPVDPKPPAVWAGFHFLSVGLAIGGATVIAHLVETRAAWPLGGFVATAGYLLVLSAQLALAT